MSRELTFEGMNRTDFIQYWNSHPALNLTQFAKEAGISRRTLQRLLARERPLTEETRDKIQPVAEKYGYHE